MFTALTVTIVTLTMFAYLTVAIVTLIMITDLTVAIVTLSMLTGLTVAIVTLLFEKLWHFLRHRQSANVTISSAAHALRITSALPLMLQNGTVSLVSQHGYTYNPYPREQYVYDGRLNSGMFVPNVADVETGENVITRRSVDGNRL